MSAFVCAAAAGCDNIFDKREKLALPECVLLDDYVYWEQVAGAEGYVVSVNGEELPEQTDCGYRLDKSVDADVKVKAVAAQDSGEFKDSVLRYPYSAGRIRRSLRKLLIPIYIIWRKTATLR